MLPNLFNIFATAFFTDTALVTSSSMPSALSSKFLENNLGLATFLSQVTIFAPAS